VFPNDAARPTRMTLVPGELREQGTLQRPEDFGVRVARSEPELEGAEIIYPGTDRYVISGDACP
jgi:hypothetical protein